MAAADPSNCKPASAERSMFFERFDRVFGAGGVIAAGATQDRRQGQLIEAYQKNEEQAW